MQKSTGNSSILKEHIESVVSEENQEQKQLLINKLVSDFGNDIISILHHIKSWFQDRESIPSSKKIRNRWENHLQNQVVDPLQLIVPESAEEVGQLIRLAETQNCSVKAIGSGHSFTDVTQTTDYLVSTTKLNAWVDLDTTVLNGGLDTSLLVHVESGMKIHELNEHLDSRGLALINMGGYDGQSIVGATSTGTHGSGINIGPLESFYKSIILFAAGGQQYRIEPSNGITDAVKHRAKYPNIVLVQNDEWFNTVKVSMGCTGIICSVIIEVRPKFWLKEVRTLVSWQEVKRMISEENVLNKNAHFEVLVNPYRINNQHSCLVTTRNEVREPKGPLTDKNERNFLAELFGLIPGIHHLLSVLSFNLPQLFPKIIEKALEGLVDDSYINKSYKVFNIGTTNNVSAYGSELAIPMKNNIYIDAVEKIFDIADNMKNIGQVYHVSPFSLRFVKASDSYLSMMHDRDTCMIEISMANGIFAGFQMLERYERELMKFNMRPHWGLINYLTASNDLIARLYPEVEKWLKVYKQLNKNGTFDNRFSYRCGFSEYRMS